MSHRSVSRRRFLKSSLAAASGGMALPYFVPSHVLAAPGRAGANDRVNIGYIGTGGMGMGHMQSGAVAICDVDDRHIADAVSKAGGKPFTCRDYRALLDRKDVDAVMISTPDHCTRCKPSTPARPARMSTPKSRPAARSRKGRR